MFAASGLYRRQGNKYYVQASWILIKRIICAILLFLYNIVKNIYITGTVNNVTSWTVQYTYKWLLKIVESLIKFQYEYVSSLASG